MALHDPKFNPTTNRKPLRVAAYVRVSTAKDAQEDSFSLQSSYYSQLIASHSGWMPAGIYADRGFSGTSARKRPAFSQLLLDCQHGLIDHILCKSISRFSRNALDLLQIVRLLSQLGITIYFENDNLDTGHMTAEVVLTIKAAVAQEEMKNLSDNVKWALQRNFSGGTACFNDMYGYRVLHDSAACAGPRITIVEEEARVIRSIFQMAQNGLGYTQIARTLNQKMIPLPYIGPDGARRRKRELTAHSPLAPAPAAPGWTDTRIRSILQNERYTGDALCQKTYTVNVLTHKKLPNHGKVPQYYIANHHPAIISREAFTEVQNRLSQAYAGRRIGQKKPHETYPLSGLLICGNCGWKYMATKRPRGLIWTCKLRLRNTGGRPCCSEPIENELLIQVLQKGFVRRFLGEYREIREFGGVGEFREFGEFGGVGGVGEFGEFREFRESDEYAENSNTCRAKGRRQTMAHPDRYPQFESDFAATAQPDGSEPCRKNLNIASILSELLKQPSPSTPASTNHTGQASHCPSSADKVVFRPVTETSRDLLTIQQYRSDAIQWLSTLPEDNSLSVPSILQSLSTKHVRAWVLDIIVYSKKRYLIRWFDGSTTQIIN